MKVFAITMTRGKNQPVIVSTRRAQNADAALASYKADAPLLKPKPSKGDKYRYTITYRAIPV